MWALRWLARLARRLFALLLLLTSLAGALDLPAGYPTWYRCIRYRASYCDSIKSAMPVNVTDIFLSWDTWRLIYVCGLVVAVALLLPASVYRRASKAIHRQGPQPTIEAPQGFTTGTPRDHRGELFSRSMDVLQGIRDGLKAAPPQEAHFIDRGLCWRVTPEFFSRAPGSWVPFNKAQLDPLLSGPFCPTCGYNLVQTQPLFGDRSVAATAQNPCACGWRNTNAAILGMELDTLRRAVYGEAQHRLNTRGPAAFAPGPCPDTRSV